MLERLRLIAEKYGLGEDARRELAELVGAQGPLGATVRIDDDEDDGPRTPSSPSLRQKTFGDRYEDVKHLGTGGFSEVREVRDLHVGRSVARKEQLPTVASPEDVVRFRREVAITARVEHPGVVPLYDWGELPDGRVWFTMKRVHGETIEKRIAALHRLSGADFGRALRRLLDDFRRLCEPVAYAHTRGIIHRDITPQNLMVGELGEVLVMDWGLARDLSRSVDERRAREWESAEAKSDSPASSPRTRAAGTPSYMAPEQARGEIAAMSPASDVYALGAVLYEILSGQAPFDPRPGARESPQHIVALLRQGPPAPIETIARAEAPVELFPLCARAMARAPGDRFAHAGELMIAMRDWLDGADREERAHAIVASAHRDHVPAIERLRREADEKRLRSREILDKLRSFDRAQDKAEGWQLADDAAQLEQDALREETIWTQKLRSALNEAPGLEEAHTALADHYTEGLLRAETDHHLPAATRFATLLESHAGELRPEARARYDQLLRGDGRLTMVTDPPGARVAIKRYELIDRYLTLDEATTRVVTAPFAALDLPRGSYLALITAPGFREVRYPVAIGRGEHWDGVRPEGQAPCPIRLLSEEELGADNVYVPGGWFILGGDPRAGESLPRQRAWLDGFVIRKHPITNGDYVEFLNALIAEDRADEALQCCPREPPGAHVNDSALLAYRLDEHTGLYALMAPETDHARPVVFVDWHAATAYAAHLARRTGLPWRLPSEMEWEKAARGVDGRFMPWGDQVEPTWACVSGSHRERKRIMPVDDYLTDVSPYGVRGMAGNVRDWCCDRWSLEGPRVIGGVVQVEPARSDDDSYRPLRGGAWISAGDLSRLSVRYAERPSWRHGVLGFRLARTITP
ncbi:MAG: bifunctional serine/threonine-protein kinase/formylglycine-generating enzyme family protein [Byssovorax sp.]